MSRDERKRRRARSAAGMRARRAAAIAACLALLGTAAPAIAQSCAGTFESLYRQSDPRLREFLQGVWQGEGPDTVGNFRRSTYSFHVNGTFTRDEAVCVGMSNACGPSIGQGYFAVYSVQQGVVSLALYESNANCSVSHLVIGDRDTMYGVQDPSRRPLLRVR
jgi:hypothetical protein